MRRLVLSAGATALTVACLAWLLTGCSIGWDDFQATAFTQPATDTIQTRTFNAIGLQTVPESGLVSFGWLRSQETTVPAFAMDDKIPDVSVSTDVNADSGIAIVDRLDIGVLSSEPEREPTAIENLLGIVE